MNEDHHRLLRSGVSEWNTWRYQTLSTRPDLSGANLSGAILRKANLGEADLSGADLRGANLRHAELTSANLSEADLSEADLRAAVLRGADLRIANLRGADLRAANLRGANLRIANLRGANLSHAELSHAELTSADLSDANLSGSYFGWTNLGNVDLSAPKGLDTITHNAPSTIGVDTIYLSQGRIPEVFLRGAGVPDAFIAYIPSLIGGMSAIDFYSCFISYSHVDKSFARRLFADLQAVGIRCWLDEHQLLPGDDMYQQIDLGIRLWDKVILCCSKASLTSWWVDNEIDTAFEKERQIMKTRGEKVLAVVPLNLDDYLFDDAWTSGKRIEVRSRIAANFRGWKRSNTIYEAARNQLIKALRADAGAREAPPLSKL